MVVPEGRGESLVSKLNHFTNNIERSILEPPSPSTRSKKMKGIQLDHTRKHT